MNSDFILGFIVSIQAYAALAGLPAVYGLYAALVPFYIYAVFGSSPQLVMGMSAVKLSVFIIEFEVLQESVMSGEFCDLFPGLPSSEFQDYKLIMHITVTKCIHLLSMNII